MANPLQKQCSVCNIVKGVDEYYRRSGGKDGRYALCKPCHAIKRKRYGYKPRSIEAQRAYVDAHRDEVRRNRRKYYQANKDKEFARQKVWREKNFSKVRGSFSSRNNKKLGWIDPMLIGNYYTKICGICELKIENSFEIDHIIPLSRNGTHTLENLQLTHPICNRTKHNRLQQEILLDVAILRALVL